MSIFRVFVDGQLFYHPQLSQLAITKAQVQEDVENIDSLTLAAPFNHPYLSIIKPMASAIVCKKGGRTVFEGRALDEGSDFYNTRTWTCESCLAYLKDSIQPPYDYSGTLKGLLEYFLSEHNKNVGTYVLGNALYNRAPCENLNRVTRSIFYKKTSDTEWINSGYIFSSGDPIVFGGGNFSTEYSYDIKYTIQDAFNTVSVIDLISTAAVVMDFKSGGKGVAVGKVSETDNMFEVSDKWDVKVYGKLLKDYIQSVAGAIYPVGSIYMSVSPANPSTYFGGTWVAWGSGRVPVGINTADSNFNTVEKTGGASTVALTVAQMPSHSHAKGTLAADSGGSHGHNLNLTKAAWGVDGASNKVVVDSTGYTAMTNKATASGGSHGHTISGSTASAGSGSAHSNLQPYIVCYMWKRTA